MKLRIIALLAIVVVALATAATQVAADGIVIAEPPPCLRGDCSIAFPFLPIKYHRVEVEIHGQLAEVRVDQAFENPGDTMLEGRYVFPLPEDAAISDFTMSVDGEQLEGRLLDRDQAREIYEEIVRQRRDPALLEYVDRGVFQASVFPIPPHEERRVQIRYTQVLEREGGLVRFVYPLSTEKFSPEPIPEVTVTVEIDSTEPLRSVYSPSHDVAIVRDGDRSATASLELADVTPQTDLELLYSTSDEDVDLSLLTYRTGDEDGYFLLLVSPKLGVEATEVDPRDVVLVLDTSGSMEGEKIDQAKEAARHIVGLLNPDDRFSVVAFNSAVQLSDERLRRASEDRSDALAFIDGLQAGGATNIHDALLAALGQLSGGTRPALVIFLTDGLPTVGPTDEAAILSAVESAAPRSLRLFTFGVGFDVNTFLLDELAQLNHGLSEYVRPEEDVFGVVAGFYERVSDPVLSDVSLDFGAVTVSDVYPNPLPDLFAGSQLVVAGRYSGSGTVDVTLSGSLKGEAQEFVYDSQRFPTLAARDSNVQRLWAVRKIGFLLNSIRFNGQNDEVVEEVVALSKRFGIITPYTSFLVEEPSLSVEDAQNRFELEALPDLDRTSGAPASGRSAFDTAVKVAEYGDALSLSGVDGAAEAEQVRIVGGKAFLLDEEVWTDTTYNGGPTAKIGFASDGYFDALRERPDWGAYAALGERVIFVSDGRAFEIAAGEFPAVDVPDAPAQQQAAADVPDVDPRPNGPEELSADGGGSAPWVAIIAGAAAAAVAVLAGAGAWWRRDLRR